MKKIRMSKRSFVISALLIIGIGMACTGSYNEDKSTTERGNFHESQREKISAELLELWGKDYEIESVICELERLKKQDSIRLDCSEIKSSTQRIVELEFKRDLYLKENPQLEDEVKKDSERRNDFWKSQKDMGWRRNDSWNFWITRLGVILVLAGICVWY